MKALWNVISIFLVIHLIAVLILIGWLWRSDRLNQPRLDSLVEMFRVTISDEQAMLEETAEAEEKQRQAIRDLARLEEVAHGLTSVDDRLRTGHEDEEVGLQKLEWTKRAIVDLLQNLEKTKAQLVRQKKENEAEREAFEKAVAEKTTMLADESFQHAVKLYENMDPELTKQNFLELIKQNKEDQVVDYLSAMQLRKAAKVLGQFEGPKDVAVATRLIQRLRERGVELTTTGPNKRADKPT